MESKETVPNKSKEDLHFPIQPDHETEKENLIPKEAMVCISGALSLTALLDYSVSTIEKIGLISITNTELLSAFSTFFSTFCISYGVINLTDYIVRHKRQKLSLNSTFKPIYQNEEQTQKKLIK